MMPLGISFVQETTVFRDFGPVAGRSLQVVLQRITQLRFELDCRARRCRVDVRHYTRLAANGLFAVRLKGQRSWGAQPDFMYFGGNSELRGYDYLEFIGHHAFFANAELRFPIIDAVLTPFGVLGGLRGVFFAGIGGAGFNGQSFVPWTSKTEIITPVVGYRPDASGNLTPVYGPPQVLSGFRLRDTRALVRDWPRERAARSADALRLVVADALQFRVGRFPVRRTRRRWRAWPPAASGSVPRDSASGSATTSDACS